MTREDLSKFAEIIYKRKQQRLDTSLGNEEQEFNRLFLWLMRMMEEEVEERYPPEGKILKRFVCESDDERRVTISSAWTKSKFVSIPSMKRDEVYVVIASVVDFIGELEGYEIINRFPTEVCNGIDEFMIVIKYSGK